MKVFVTGVDGYIGSLLGPLLLNQGYEVVGLDTGFYRDGWLYNTNRFRFPELINKDLRDIEPEDLAGVDAVIHLAELSNDPLGQLNPDITYKINHLGSVKLASMGKEMGISRFLYASSCSVYGVGGAEGYKTEMSEVNPQTAYAKCKVMVERDVSALADDNFSPTFFRNATAYGPSPRQRFDIVLNNLAGLAWTTNEIKMTSDGTPWRPLVHVLDICQAFACALEAPRETVHNQVYNVGDTKENYRVKEIAQIVADTFPGCELSFGSSDGDNRSYRVSFDKINSQLPGFKCQRDAATGARQMYELFNRINMSDDIFTYRAYTRLKQLKHLIHTQQIDTDFYWNS